MPASEYKHGTWNLQRKPLRDQFTWRGHICGHWEESVLDYIMLDDVTAEGDVSIEHLVPGGFPW